MTEPEAAPLPEVNDDYSRNDSEDYCRRNGDLRNPNPISPFHNGDTGAITTDSADPQPPIPAGNPGGVRVDRPRAAERGLGELAGDGEQSVGVVEAEVQAATSAEEIPEPEIEIPEPVRVSAETEREQIPEPAPSDANEGAYEIPEPLEEIPEPSSEIPEPLVYNPEPLEVQAATSAEEIPEPEIEINSDDFLSKDRRLWNLEIYKDRHGKYRAKRVLRFVTKPPKIELGKVTEEISEELKGRRGKGRWKLSREEAEEFRSHAELVAESIRRDKGQRSNGQAGGSARRNQDNSSESPLLPEAQDSAQWDGVSSWMM